MVSRSFASRSWIRFAWRVVRPIHATARMPRKATATIAISLIEMRRLLSITLLHALGGERMGVLAHRGKRFLKRGCQCDQCARRRDSRRTIFYDVQAKPLLPRPGGRAGVQRHRCRRRFGWLRGETTVLLLEAGRRDRDPWICIPAGFYRDICNPRLPAAINLSRCRSVTSAAFFCRGACEEAAPLRFRPGAGPLCPLAGGREAVWTLTADALIRVPGERLSDRVRAGHEQRGAVALAGLREGAGVLRLSLGNHARQLGELAVGNGAVTAIGKG